MAENKVTTEERAEIVDLTARYAHYIDSREARAWAELFTPDGEFIIPEVDLHLKGHDQLANWVERDMIAPPNGPLFHSILSQFLIKMPNGEIHGMAKAITALPMEIDNRIPILTTGVYHDIFVKTEKGWRISSRKGSARIPLEPEFIY